MLDRLQNDFLPLQMAKIAFDPPDDVDAREMQDNAVKVLAFLVRERPPLLFGTCDRLIAWLERATVYTAELSTLLRDQRATIFEKRGSIEQAMKRPDPFLHGWIEP
jgi:hypothetical protein